MFIISLCRDSYGYPGTMDICLWKSLACFNFWLEEKKILIWVFFCSAAAFLLFWQYFEDAGNKLNILDLGFKNCYSGIVFNINCLLHNLYTNTIPFFQLITVVQSEALC